MAMNETLSTLRFAERAKRIKNKAVVNEDGDEKVFQKKYYELLKQIESMKSGNSLQLPVSINCES